MTRINCVPVETLHDRHLLAEYRELPRIFKLAKHVNDAPANYKMGTGHVKFFYDKLEFLYNRQVQLVNEMKVRGFKPQFEASGLLDFKDKKSNLWNNWKPSFDNMAINQARINERLNAMKK